MREIKSVTIITEEDEFLPKKFAYIVYDSERDRLCTYNDVVKELAKYKEGGSVFGTRNLDGIKKRSLTFKELQYREYGLYERVRNLRYELDDEQDKSRRKLSKKYDINLGDLPNMYYIERSHFSYDCDGQFMATMNNYKKLKDLVLNECKQSDIKYREDADLIIREAVDKIAEDLVGNALDGCHSRQEMYMMLEDKKSNCKTAREMEALSNMIECDRRFMIFYPAAFFKNSSELLEVIDDKTYCDREELLSKWAEFLIVLPEYCGMLQTLENFAGDIYEKSTQDRLDSYYENQSFINDVMMLMDHDKNQEIYHYHATTSKKAADNILDKGLFLMSDDLSSTAFTEFNLDDVLTYQYQGSGLFDTVGDYVVIIRQPDGEDIIRPTTDLEKENNNIMARRMGLNTAVNSYVIDSSNIVGYIDKVNQNVVKNEKFVKNLKIESGQK